MAFSDPVGLEPGAAQQESLERLLPGVRLPPDTIGVKTVTGTAFSAYCDYPGRAVWLNADMLSPYDFWQYWRNTEDADVGRGQGVVALALVGLGTVGLSEEDAAIARAAAIGPRSS